MSLAAPFKVGIFSKYMRCSQGDVPNCGWGVGRSKTLHMQLGIQQGLCSLRLGAAPCHYNVQYTWQGNKQLYFGEEGNPLNPLKIKTLICKKFYPMGVFTFILFLMEENVSYQELIHFQKTYLILQNYKTIYIITFLWNSPILLARKPLSGNEARRIKIPIRADQPMFKTNSTIATVI